MKAYAWYNPARLSFDLVVRRHTGGQDEVFLPVIFTVQRLAGGERGPNEPTFSFPEDMAESVFQALWDAGLRPAKGQGGAAEVEALKNHISFAEHVAKMLLGDEK